MSAMHRGRCHPRERKLLPSEPGCSGRRCRAVERGTYFGRASKADDGRRFTLLAVVADSATNLQFRTYLKSGEVTQNFLGLSDLGGAAVLSQIQVIRGPYLPPSDRSSRRVFGACLRSFHRASAI